MGRQQGLDKEPELLTALEAMREAEGFDLSFLMVTDILSEATDLLVAGVNQAKVTEAFGKPEAQGHYYLPGVAGVNQSKVTEAFGKPEAQGHYYLPGVLSRKKQIIPPLTDAFTK